MPLDKIISISVADKKVSEILKILQKEAKVDFNYKSGILPKQPVKSFSVSNEKLSEIWLFSVSMESGTGGAKGSIVESVRTGRK